MQSENSMIEDETISIRRYLAIIFTIAIGVVVSSFLFIVVKNWEQKDQRIKYESVVKGYANAVRNSLNGNVEALKFLGDFFDNSIHVSRQEFSRYAKSVLPRYPGIQAFSWNPLVPDKERTDYESLAREEGLENFKFTERTRENKLVTADHRKEYIIVYYIEPLETNKPALGFDIASNPARLKAITKGFNTAKLSATDRITLVQESGDQIGILLLLPIYRQGALLKTMAERFENRKGFVVEVIRIGDVIEAALEGFADEGINLYLYDLSADVKKRSLYYRPSRLSGMPEQPMAEKAIQKGLYWNETFDFAGRQWKLILSPSSFYLKSRQMWQAWMVLFSSLFLTSILAFYLFKKLRYTVEIERKINQEIRANQQLAAEISERQQAEAALRESEARYRKLFISNPHPMWIYDLETLAFLDVNDAAISHYGYSRQEFLSMTIKDIRPAEDVPRLIENIAQVGEGLDKAGVWRHIRKDGSVIEVEITSHVFVFDAHRTELVLVNDITDRRRIEGEREELQAQLLQAQKMESVGRLAGGVAHDFNNMLGVILGRAEMMFMEIKPGDSPYTDLQEIYKAAQRSADLTRQLLAFARKQAIAPLILDLNETVEGMLKMLRRLIGEDIDLVWKPDTHLWPVRVDPAQVDQVLANLCVNARDAIYGTGKVTIETDNVFFDKDYCASHTDVKPGQYVMLAVSDDGCGMGKETLENLFEPFFTTKEVGEGTGLGLAMIYGIVKQNNGFINVSSEPGLGTTFKLYLPRSTEVGEAGGEPMAKTIEHGSETVLLVEDEASILRLGTAVLEKFGYKVLAASTPGQAISMAEQCDGTIHILVTDVVMPEMNGKELKKRIEKTRPRIKVLFMSGYTDDVIVHRGILDGDVNFLQKPFSVNSLADMVRKVLDQQD